MLLIYIIPKTSASVFVKSFYWTSKIILRWMDALRVSVMTGTQWAVMTGTQWAVADDWNSMVILEIP